METVTLVITGMICGACVGHVSRGLQSVTGVRTVEVDLARASAIISGEALNISQLIEAVEEEGYGAKEKAGAQTA